MNTDRNEQRTTNAQAIDNRACVVPGFIFYAVFKRANLTLPSNNNQHAITMSNEQIGEVNLTRMIACWIKDYNIGRRVRVHFMHRHIAQALVDHGFLSFDKVDFYGHGG